MQLKSLIGAGTRPKKDGSIEESWNAFLVFGDNSSALGDNSGALGDNSGASLDDTC